MKAYTQGLSPQKKNFAKACGERLRDVIDNHPMSFFKAIAAFFLMSEGIVLFNLLAVYGLYRFTNQEWTDHFRWLAQGSYNFIRGFRKSAQVVVNEIDNQSFDKKMYMTIGLVGLLGAELYFSGLSHLFGLGFLVFQGSAVSIGFMSAWNDFKYLLKNPFKVASDHPGKIAGMWWGYSLAHKLFAGFIKGDLGPTQGVMQNSLTEFFNLPLNRFIFNNTGLGLIFDRIRNFTNNILSTLFFTSHVETYGTFIGTVGPSPLQLFLLMAIGFGVGVMVEKLVKNLYYSVGNDAANIQEKADNLTLGQWLKIHTGVITCLTPAMMYFDSGTILTMAGGSLLYGSLLTAGLLAATFSSVHAISFTLKRIIQWASSRQVNNDLAPVPQAVPLAPQAAIEAPQVASAPLLEASAPAFTPGFNSGVSNNNLAPSQPEPSAPSAEALENMGRRLAAV